MGCCARQRSKAAAVEGGERDPEEWEQSFTVGFRPSPTIVSLKRDDGPSPKADTRIAGTRSLY
jgi:hypothetical protein